LLLARSWGAGFGAIAKSYHCRSGGPYKTFGLGMLLST
jgi:hypothetical protein